MKGVIAGRYQLVRRVGNGGMGSIWEAHDAQVGARVALKLIKQSVDNADVQERFITEARVYALLRSEHIVRIHDYGKTPEGLHYMVMELLSGESLEERLARVGRLSLVETASIVGQVCAALQQAHDHGIVHRDIKPENVFITERGVVKLLDFGLAKVRHPDTAPLSGTRTGTILGTPLYMSPEQGRALKSVDHHTDVWSLGVVAFRCVTGRVPFEANSFADLLVRACAGAIPKASSMQLDIPTAFDAWAALALHPDPAQRFDTVTALSRALTTVAQDAVRSGSAATQPMRQWPPRPITSRSPR